MRPPIWTLLAIPVLGLLGWYILTQGKAAPAPQAELEQPFVHLLNCTDAGNDCKHTENTPYYSISVVYPKESASQQKLETLLLNEVDRFKTDADVMLDDAEKDRLNETGRKYELGITYQAFEGSGYNSYKFDVYLDTGGAHPNAYYQTIVFDAEGNVIGLEDLGNPQYLNIISEESYDQISKELASRAGVLTPDMQETIRLGTAPSPETLQFFVIDGNEVVMLFPPYQVAAYAAGSFEARIPLSQLTR